MMLRQGSEPRNASVSALRRALADPLSVVHGGLRASLVHELVDSRFCKEATKLFHIYDLVPGLKENQFPVLKFYVLAPKTSNSITF
jgi:hypothetical protein